MCVCAYVRVGVRVCVKSSKEHDVDSKGNDCAAKSGDDAVTMCEAG